MLQKLRLQRSMFLTSRPPDISPASQYPLNILSDFDQLALAHLRSLDGYDGPEILPLLSTQPIAPSSRMPFTVGS